MKELVEVFDFLLVMVGVMISVAFFTLTERKVLSYMQIRKGPNKVMMAGIIQPLLDGGKLFLKEGSLVGFVNYVGYYCGPILGLFLSLMMWLMIPLWFGMYESMYGMILLFCIMSMGVYSLIFSGWMSNSKYSLLGAGRSISQVISYEVSMMLYIMVFVMYYGSYSFSSYFDMGWMFKLAVLLCFVWIFIVLAEVNRSPYDFSEGESELVSGFNTEYGSGLFSLIFIAEYASIMMMSGLSVVFFFSGDLFYLKLMVISYLIIVVRGCYPRMRYDKLMEIAWKSFLPVGLFLYLVVLSLML